MAVKKVKDLISDVLSASNLNDQQLSEFEGSLKENQEKCFSQSNQSLVLFLTTTLAWFLIKSASISKINILDIELTDLQIPLLILPIVAAFSFYNHQSAFVFATLIDDVLRGIRVKKYKSFSDKNLDELLSYPSPLLLESSVENLENTVGIPNKTTTVLWILAIYITTSIIPLLVLIYICLTLLLQPVFGYFLTILSVVLTLLLTLRAISFVIKTWRL